MIKKTKITYVGVVCYSEESIFMVKVSRPWKQGEDLEEILSEKFDLGDINYQILEKPVVRRMTI